MRYSLAALATATLFATSALAAPVTVTGVSTVYTNPQVTEQLQLNGTNLGTVAVGQIVLTTADGSIYSWCVDVEHEAVAAVFESGTFSLGNDGNDDQLYQIEALAIRGNAAADTFQSAAYQNAIWTVEYGEALVISNISDPSVAQLTTEYLSDTENASPVDGETFYALTASSNQAQLVATVPVPEPAPLGIIGGGLLTIGLLRHQRNRTVTA